MECRCSMNECGGVNEWIRGAREKEKVYLNIHRTQFSKTIKYESVTWDRLALSDL